MMNLSQEIIFTAAALACAGLASVHDVRERRIPNLLTGPSILIALSLHLFAGGWRELGASALAGLIAGSLLLLLFVVGGMGAGDVKLMTAVGCFVGLHPLGLVLFATALCGAALGIALAVHHGRLRQTFSNAFTLIGHHGRRGLAMHSELNLGNAAALRMPFALPIAAGCLITAGMQMWSA